jgi:antitoxin VapB
MWYPYTMALNIKNDETHRMVRQLAKLTGESQTIAVKNAVQERLNRLRRGSGGSLSDRLLAIGRDCAAHLKDKSIDHADLLYDERGLPK